MKIYKRIIVTFVTAILTVMLVYGGYTIYALGKYDFQLPLINNFLWSTKAVYQATMNQFFNDKVADFLAIYKAKGATAFQDSRMIAPSIKDPSAIEEARAKCIKDTKNLSPYCVSVQALDMYIAYIATLENMRANIPISVQTGVATLPTVNDFIDKRERDIIQEIDNSQKELETVVAVYDQFLFNWPIHIKLNETKKELITYKNKLKKIRQKVERFPGKFVDNTSTKCE